ncbi:MAG: ribonuclease P protein component [Lachnospiraceae bacterium]|nr:ribonuclease P protein component [Lachnospiraceae bacterium]
MKEESLKKNCEYQNVYRNGKSLANRYLVMYVLDKEETDNTRMGISVSKKVGNSVVRHRLTRLLREIYRLNKQSIVFGKDIVVVVRVSAKGISYRDMESAFFHLLKMHGIEKEMN